jgi:hypothetical protein
MTNGLKRAAGVLSSLCAPVPSSLSQISFPRRRRRRRRRRELSFLTVAGSSVEDLTLYACLAETRRSPRQRPAGSCRACTLP